MFCFSTDEPSILLSRWCNLQGLNRALDTILGHTLIWFDRFIRLIRNDLDNRAKIKLHFANQLEHSFSGNGIAQVGENQACSFYVNQPPKYWTCSDYIRAVQLRSNLMPCKSIPSNPTTERRCKDGCGKNETQPYFATMLEGAPCTLLAT